jgi:hypothetical protein
MLVRISSPLCVGIKTPINSALLLFGFFLKNRRGRRTLVALAQKISVLLNPNCRREKQEEVVRNLPIALVKPEEHRRAPSPTLSSNRRLPSPPAVYAGPLSPKVRELSSLHNPNIVAETPSKTKARSTDHGLL